MNVRLEVLGAVEKHLGGTLRGEQGPFGCDDVGYGMMVRVAKFCKAENAPANEASNCGFANGGVLYNVH